MNIALVINNERIGKLNSKTFLRLSSGNVNKELKKVAKSLGVLRIKQTISFNVEHLKRTLLVLNMRYSSRSIKYHN